uniref:Uncharacterized protein n=1 Tax=Arundo donax TaxID=35708 RepID=A0A0A8YL01_ARUDO
MCNNIKLQTSIMATYSSVAQIHFCWEAGPCMSRRMLSTKKKEMCITSSQTQPHRSLWKIDQFRKVFKHGLAWYKRGDNRFR